MFLEELTDAHVPESILIRNTQYRLLNLKQYFVFGSHTEFYPFNKSTLNHRGLIFFLSLNLARLVLLI